jgi:hypothetical protein
MKRRHLLEFNERSECPKFIRDSVVETLGMGLRFIKMGNIIGPPFAEFMQRAKVSKVLDLCTGTGVPVSLLAQWLKDHGDQSPKFLVSDLFPNHEAFEEITNQDDLEITSVAESVNALDVNPELEHDTRTIINSFHHFTPAMAEAILEDTVQKDKSIFIYEGFRRDPMGLAPTGPWMTLALLANPWLAKRSKLLKIIFSYLIPIIPIMAMWDGFVSTLRIHTQEDLMQMVSKWPHYEWSYSEHPYARGGRAVIFSGNPKNEQA